MNVPMNVPSNVPMNVPSNVPHESFDITPPPEYDSSNDGNDGNGLSGCFIATPIYITLLPILLPLHMLWSVTHKYHNIKTSPFFFPIPIANMCVEELGLPP